MVAPRAFELRVVGVHGDEQRRPVALGELAARLQLDEHVRVARHQHLVAAGRRELVAQLEAEREHDVLLDRAVLRGARVVAAVAGIDAR